MAEIPEQLFCREINKEDSSSGFSLDSSEYTPLKIFLRKQAVKFHDQNVTKTYVLSSNKEKGRIWGYCSLNCSEIDLGKDSKFHPYTHLPAIKLTRLAIDHRLQKKGLGKQLVQHGLSIAKDIIMKKVGCRFLLVDSKPNAISFYEKLGFIEVPGIQPKKTTALIFDLSSEIPSDYSN